MLRGKIKRLLSSVLIVGMLCSIMTISSMAANEPTVIYDLTVNGSNNATATRGEIITVVFSIQCDTDSDSFETNGLQNDIIWDRDFFEYVDGSAKVIAENGYAELKNRFGGIPIILVAHQAATHPKTFDYCEFKLMVLETATGTGWIKNDNSKVLRAASVDEITIEPKAAYVTIGDSSNVPVTSVTVSPTEKTLTYIGESFTLVPTVKPDNATNKSVSYSSSNTSVATVGADGTVRAVSEGTATITVTTDDGGKTATCVVIVKKPSEGNDSGGGTVIIKKYTLTFYTDGGSEIDSLEVREGTKVSLDKYVSEKAGYKFDGWYSDKELTKKVTEITINKDITVYAKWVATEDEPVIVQPGYKPGILTDEHYAYIVGREDGMIAPESEITRAEVATIIYRLLDEDVRNKAKTKENVFTDVNEDDWFNTAVSTLASLELIKGRTTDSFAPNAFITRAELATIFARMVEVEYDGKVLFSDVSGHWAESYINEAATAEWIVGHNGLFRPDDNITRAEVMTLVNRVLNREPESKADLLDGMTTWKDNANENVWYYLAIQEATNSHTYEMKADGKHEKWASITENPNWVEIEN